jgi:hypothetical protein
MTAIKSAPAATLLKNASSPVSALEKVHRFCVLLIAMLPYLG